MHEKKKTESERAKYTEYACEVLAQRRGRRVSLSSALSVGRRSLLRTTWYLELCAWTHASPVSTAREDVHAADFAFDFAQRAKGTHAAYIGVSRNFRACAYGRCNAGGIKIILEECLAFLASGSDPTGRVRCVART